MSRVKAVAEALSDNPCGCHHNTFTAPINSWSTVVAGFYLFTLTACDFLLFPVKLRFEVLQGACCNVIEKYDLHYALMVTSTSRVFIFVKSTLYLCYRSFSIISIFSVSVLTTHRNLWYNVYVIDFCTIPKGYTLADCICCSGLY